MRLPRPTSSHGSSLLSGSMTTGSTISTANRSESPFAQDVPIGERAGPNAKSWGRETPDRTPLRSREISPDTELSSDVSRDNRRATTQHSPATLGSPSSHDVRRKTSSSRELRGGSGRSSLPRDLNEAMMMAGDGSPTLKRASAKRYQYSPVSPTAQHENRLPTGSMDGDRPLKSSDRKRSGSTRDYLMSRDDPSVSTRSGYSVWMPSSSDVGSSEEGDEETHFSATSSQYSELHRRTASLPTKDPLVSRLRPSDELRATPRSSKRASLGESSSRTVNATDRTQFTSHVRSSSSPYTPTTSDKHHTESHSFGDMKPKKPNEIRRSWLESVEPAKDPNVPPPPPPHTTPLTPPNDVSDIPKLNPSMQNTKRRSSSPLKHEYQPSFRI